MQMTVQAERVWLMFLKQLELTRIEAKFPGAVARLGLRG